MTKSISALMLALALSPTLAQAQTFHCSVQEVSGAGYADPIANFTLDTETDHVKAIELTAESAVSCIVFKAVIPQITCAYAAQNRPLSGVSVELPAKSFTLQVFDAPKPVALSCAEKR